MSDFPIPPPSFEFLVYSLKMQAEMHLGLYGAQEDGSCGPNLPAARHTIDMLAMLGEKTRGNLSMEEQRAIENSLTELRFRFVQAAQAPSNSDAPAVSGEDAQAAPKDDVPAAETKDEPASA